MWQKCLKRVSVAFDTLNVEIAPLGCRRNPSKCRLVFCADPTTLFQILIPFGVTENVPLGSGKVEKEQDAGVCAMQHAATPISSEAQIQRQEVRNDIGPPQGGLFLLD